MNAMMQFFKKLRPPCQALHATMHLNALELIVRIYDPASQRELAHGRVDLENIEINTATLSDAIRQAINACAFHGKIPAIRLILDAPQCLIAQHAFPTGLSAPEAHALATQIGTTIAQEHGHHAPIACDWRYHTDGIITLCIAPRARIEIALQAIRAAGLSCCEVTPHITSDEAPHLPRFNVLPWRNDAWIAHGRRRLGWLIAITLILTLSGAWFASQWQTRVHDQNAIHQSLDQSLRTQRVHLPDLVELRKTLTAQQTAQQAVTTRLNLQRDWADMLDRLARARPKNLRYRSLQREGDAITITGDAPHATDIARLIATLPCLRINEMHSREGIIHFTLLAPSIGCTPTR
jgi:Tfp pilus assembly protein PilN